MKFEFVYDIINTDDFREGVKYYANECRRAEEKGWNGVDAAAKSDIFVRNAFNSHFTLVYLLALFEFAINSYGVSVADGRMEYAQF